MNIEELKRQIDFFYENATRYGIDETHTEVVIATGQVFSGVSSIFKGKYLTIVPTDELTSQDLQEPDKSLEVENGKLKEEIKILKDCIKKMEKEKGDVSNPSTTKRPKKNLQGTRKVS